MEKQPKRNKGIWKRFAWLGILGVSFLSKFKSLLPLLKLGKFGGTILSMGISVLAYAYIYTWKFAIGIVVMIFIHEMGHVWAAKRKNLPVSAPAFIPFLGALITMKKLPQDAETEAYIAFGGPLLGSLGALLCWGVGWWTGMEVFYAIALIGFALNLFNLVPISPLDGGRIVTAISRWMWVLGVILAIGLIVLTGSIVLILIFGLFAYEMWLNFRLRSKGPREITHRFEVPVQQFTEKDAIIPGEKHQRALPFTHYCDLNSRKEFVEMSYPGVGKIARLSIAQEGGEIHQVQLVQTVRKDDSQLEMFVKIVYTPDPNKKDEYYQVPIMTRVKYGVAYFGLTAFLIAMTIISYLELEKIPIT